MADRGGDWTPLHGGNVNTVSRQGEVVRRELSAASGAAHQLLKHLEKRNVPLVPWLLDSDARYEFLAHLPGEAVFRPWPDAVRGRSAVWLTDLGRWLRAYHNAVRGFRVYDAGFLWGPDETGEGMLVTHGDLGPWNCLHEGGRLTGVIDWDLARYGNPLDDVAELALEAVPLHQRHGETLGAEADRALLEARLELFCQAYGSPAQQILHHVPVYLQMVIDDMRDLSGRGVAPFVAFERGGMDIGGARGRFALLPRHLALDLRSCAGQKSSLAENGSANNAASGTSAPSSPSHTFIDSSLGGALHPRVG